MVQSTFFLVNGSDKCDSINCTKHSLSRCSYGNRAQHLAATSTWAPSYYFPQNTHLSRPAPFGEHDHVSVTWQQCLACLQSQECSINKKDLVLVSCSINENSSRNISDSKDDWRECITRLTSVWPAIYQLSVEFKIQWNASDTQEPQFWMHTLFYCHGRSLLLVMPLVILDNKIRN